MFARLLNSLFDPIPPLELWLILPAIFFVALLGIAAWLSFKFKSKHGLQDQLRGYWSNMVWTCGLIGLTVLLFRWLGVPWLGSNFLLLLTVGSAGVWSSVIFRWQRTSYREELALLERRKLHEKYLK